METVTCYVRNGELYLWLEDDQVTDTWERYPILRQWIEALLDGRPYAMFDDLEDDDWLQDHAKATGLPMARLIWQAGRRGLIFSEPDRWGLLVGSESLELLRRHQEETSGLLWIAGLRVYAFETPEAMQEMLGRWDGRPLADVPAGDCAFVLGTYADALCLWIQPGATAMQALVAAVEEIAARRGSRLAFKTMPGHDPTNG